MRVACVQMAPAHGAPSENREAMVAALERCSADLVVFPELCLSGYLLGSRAHELAEPAEGPTVAALAPVCRARGRHTVFGFVEQAGDRLYNAAALVGPKGLVGVYRKVHLFLDEPDWATPGDGGFPVWDIGVARVGVMICFDWALPEAARSLALGGADIIAHPANLVLPWCQRAMPVRALENHVFTATANRWGQESLGDSELRFSGHSLVCAPDGSVLAEAPSEEDVLLVASIDVAAARDKAITPRNDVLADRRPDQYRT